MNFNDHSNLEGKHAYLSASKYHWINYSDEKFLENYNNMLAAEQGTRIHAYAEESIRLKLQRPAYFQDEEGNLILDENGNPIKDETTLTMYINDAIRFKMKPEQILYYSDYCFGTCDAISFTRNMLRIHDLKTGTIVKAHMEQLLIYTALFCLEYRKDPSKIKMELRIYQNNEIVYYNPDPKEIREIMDTIKRFNQMIIDIRGKGNADVTFDL